MIWDLNIRCRCKDHGHLVLEENCECYYVYCRDCLMREGPFKASPYEYCGMTILRAIENYLEGEEYLAKDAPAYVWKEEWNGRPTKTKTVSGIEIKMIEDNDVH